MIDRRRFAPLDTATAWTKTGDGEEGPSRTAGALATRKTQARPPAGPGPELIRKIGALGAALAEAERRANQATAREALSRNAYTLALVEALAANARAAARLRALALQIYRRTAARGRGGARTRRLDRWLARLGSPGQALLIARSGLWRPSGPTLRHRLYDLREMAAYARRGPHPGLRPRAPLHQAWYLTAPDAAASRRAPLVHFLVSGVPVDRAPHPLFDTSYYRHRNADALAATRLAPFEHFVRLGAAEGRDPHPLFSIEWYLGQAPDLVESGDNPLTHYTEHGWRRGLSPHPLFDPAWYAGQLTPAETGEAPLIHYLVGGWRAGLSPHPLFDSRWYLQSYPDVAEARGDPLSHFAAAGGREGRNPGPWFDSAHYAAVRGEQLPAEANPLVDYLTGGAWCVGEARPGFPTAAYLAARPELARSGLTPLDHWARLAGPPPRSE